MKLLLHACCAPCSVYCIKQLRSEGIEPVIFWYNPNIHPFTEYEARLNTLKNYLQSVNAELIVEDEYGLDEFCKNTSGSIQKRCVSYCYPVRLRKTFEYAKNHGFDAVSTTLLYSIYQNHEFIKNYCEKLSVEYGIDFLYRDFRIGFWEGHEEAAESGLYMQKYCGCIFSEEDRYVRKTLTKPFLPDGFEFSSSGKSVKTVRTVENGTDVYALVKNEKTLCKAFVDLSDGKTADIIKLESFSEKNGEYYLEKLLKILFGNYKNRLQKISVTIEADRIPFFVKNGFEIFEGIKKSDSGEPLIKYSKQL